MKFFTNLVLYTLLLLNPIISHAQSPSLSSWRYNEAVTCNTISTGQFADLCHQTSDNSLWKCMPTIGIGGTCNTSSQWVQVGGTNPTWGTISGTLSNQSDLVTALAGKEASLGNPGTNGYILSSTTAGTRSWIAPPSSLAWGAITGTLSSQTDLQTALNAKQSSLTIGNLTDAGTDGITVTSGTGSVIGSGTSFAQHVSDTTHSGYLTSTDWNIFNNKQPAGSYLTANQTITLSGDTTGSGTTAITTSTVKVNGGSIPASKTIVGTNSSSQIVDASSATLSNNTTGTSANLSGTPALPNGTTATTQSIGDNTTKLATTAYVNAGITGSSAVTIADRKSVV